MAQPVTPVPENPKPSGVNSTSDAAKVEANTKEWAREVSLALRALADRVAQLENQQD